MAGAPENFNLDALLAPIPGELSVGADLRQDFSPQSIYYRLRDARAEARAAERAADGDGSDDQTPPQWRSVRDLASKALEGATKDLEIAAWYTEALLRSDGLDGLAAGARLLAGLAGQFWDDGLYPVPDEDGIPTRVAPITGLNGEGADGTLIQPLRKLTLFARPDGAPLYYYQYEDAVTVAGIAETARRQARLASGSLAFDEVESWARAAGQAHFASQRQNVAAALAAWGEMSAILEAKAGADGPSTSRVRDLLGEIAGAIAKYAPAITDEPPPLDEPLAAQAALAGDAGVAGSGAGAGAAASRAATRDDMLRELARIAEWFRKTEPNSPLAYTLDDAVRRGRMSWPELLAELVGDAGSRNAILTSLGIRPPPDEAV
jgi:type VI secretion system protein ImpA